jgi:hypothetical protein
VVRNRVVEGVQTRIGGSVWELWSQSSYPATYSDGGIEVPVQDQERHLLADELLEIPQVNRTIADA